MDQRQYLALLAVWPLCLAIILWGKRQDGTGTGLVVSYALQLWLLHWLAAAMYALPWYGDASTNLFSAWGLQESTLAVVGFTIGSTILVPLLMRDREPVRKEPWPRIAADPWLLRTYLVVGTVTYFVLEPFLHPIPTVGAVASATSNLLLIALGMGCWNGLQSRGVSRQSFWRWVALSASLPFVTIATKGFLGYGFAAMLTVFAFVGSFYRPRWKIILWSGGVGYLALSMYVTYMRDRGDIRSVVWGQEAYVTRVSAVARTFGDFEFFNVKNIDHLTRIDSRLNQNVFIGMATQYLGTHPEHFANGSTIAEALLSPIPRLLWPNKPGAAGSGDMVSQYTGRRINTQGTSIGIGHVMEWYINFGSPGVLFGMMFVGALIAWLDRMGAERLYRGDWAHFALWWLPGLSLLQVGGSFIEAVSSAAAALLVAALINWLAPARLTRRLAADALSPETAGQAPVRPRYSPLRS